MLHKKSGQAAEDLAAEYFLSKGYSLVDRNWRCRFGELDLVVEKGGALVFVEVRSKRSGWFGTPAESLTKTKLGRLRRSVYAYLQTLAQKPLFQVDAVVVTYTAQGTPPTLERIESILSE